jgi:cell wall assembly regulator SMI1
MDDVVVRLGRWLWANHPAALEALAPGLAEDELAGYEKQLGAALPAGLRALYRWRNGNGPDRCASVFRNMELMSLGDAVRTQEMLNDITFSTPNWWRRSWVPFLTNGAGSYLCWDPRGSFGGEPGQILEFWKADQDRKVVAPSFDGWLAAYVDALEAGVFAFNPESEGIEDDERWEPFLASRFAGYPYHAVDFRGKRGAKPAPPPPPIVADPARPVRIYAASTRFAVGDQVVHPTFGTGVVQTVVETKMDVLFESGLRTLVHARGGSTIEKPKPIDHGPRRPPF